MISLQLGRYRIKKWLGGGRFGDVYLAEDELLKRDFAIKVSRIKNSFSEPIIQEARLLSKLNHPNIVRFYTVDVIEGRVVIVTEYVDGKSLREIIDKEAPLSLERVLYYAIQILNALDYAHSQGVLHRDVKPENILVSKSSGVKLVDFGLARVSEADITMSLGGTPLYMSPEAWKGEYTAFSDQWSAAVVILELATGKNPFQAESLEELREKINKGVDVKRFAPFLDERLSDAISIALSIKPEQRFRTCREFAKALEPEERSIPILLYSKSKKENSLFGIKLSEEQKAAVEDRSKRILVIGGPGTGKTFCLMARVKFLVDELKVSPDRIMVTTFNIRGWRELEYKLSKMIGDKVNDIWIGNFHQIALRILSRFGFLIGLPDELEVVNPYQRGNMAKKIAKEISSQLSFSDVVVEEILERFYRSRSNMCSKEEFLDGTSGRWNEILDLFWKKYTETVHKQGKIDYDDLIYYTAYLLKEYPEVADFYRERIDHFLVDEVQDLNKAQILIIEELSKDKNLFFTGDDDQSIYQWRGADPDYMRGLVSGKDFVVHKLTKSFRLNRHIRDIAFNLISKNANRIPKVFWTNKDSERFFIDVRMLRTPNEEAEFVCDMIDILRLKEGYSYSDFCILYRTNNRGRLFERVMKRRKIPYSFQFGKSFYHREEVLFALDALKFAANPSKNSLNRLMNRVQVLGITRSYLEEDKSHKFWKIIDIIKEQTSPYEVLLSISELFGKVTSDDIDVERVLNISELIKQAKDFEMKSNSPSLKAFLRYVNFLKESGLSEEDEGVRLLSIHSAKGLEFPVVFLVGMVEGEMPLSRAMGIPEEMEEERRLCYTAITRALEKLFITYYRFSSSYTRSEEKPSRFIKEMFSI